jgi:ADP-heptose:LPS heptosyltransferase
VSARILIYQIGSLGDTIIAIPALRAIRSHYGCDAHLAVLHNLNDAGVVTTQDVLSCTHLVNEFIAYKFEQSVAKKARMAYSLLSQLRARQFDAVVSLLPSGRSSVALRRDTLFFRACGIRRTIGFQPVPDSVVRPRKDGKAMEAPNESLIRLQRLSSGGISTEKDGLFRTPLLQPNGTDANMAAEWLRARRRYPERPLVALCPGCKKPANSWPLERFIDLGRRIVASGEAEILVLGGSADRTVANRMVAEWGGEGLAAAGEFSVAGSAALISHCRLLVGVDTGSSHLAAGVGVPCVVVQSANSYPGHWDPIGESHAVLRHSVPCAGCLLNECPVVGHPCMIGITVEEVWRAVQAKMYTRQI